MPEQPKDKNKRGASTSNSSKRSLRSKLGWIVLCMGGLVAFGLFRHYTANDDSLFEMNRTFVIMFLLWLAWPELERLPRWALVAAPICAIICAWRPQYLVVAVPVILLFFMLRPSAKRDAKPKK